MVIIKPIKVIPKIHIRVIYIVLMVRLFFKAIIESILFVLIFSIKSFILSITSVLSFRLIIFAKIAPVIIPRNSILIMKMFIFC